MNTPPLKGDGKGNYRIHVVGNSGAGKSTVSQQLATILHIPYISLDRLFWNPGWVETPTAAFEERVRDALQGARSGDGWSWVADGNYTQRLKGLVDEAATDVIWLDPPFMLYLPRLCWRTLLRWVHVDAPCSPGCDESLRKVFFSRESIVWFCIKHHGVVRKREGERLRHQAVENGGNMRRIGGWGSEQATWLQSIERMAA